MINPAQATQACSSGHDSLTKFRKVFWMNFNLILISKLEIPKSLWFLHINTSFVTLWGLEIQAKRLEIIEIELLETSHSLKVLFGKKSLIATTFSFYHSRIRFFELLVKDCNPFKGTKGSTREQQVFATL